jgi:hypothetical protein
MTTLNNIFAKFSAQEPMKVELTIVNEATKLKPELKSFIDGLGNWEASFSQYADDLDLVLNKMNAHSQKFYDFIENDEWRENTLWDRSAKLISQAEIQAKQFGLEPAKIEWIAELEDLDRKSAIAFGQASSNGDKFNAAKKKIQGIINEIKSI